jgi:hypothetical protein
VKTREQIEAAYFAFTIGFTVVVAGVIALLAWA